MGFFTTIIWVAIGINVIIFYVVFLVKFVSKGKHIEGKPIAQEKFKSIKFRYYIVLMPLIFLVFAVPSIVPKPTTAPDAWKTNDNRTMAYVMMQNFVKENLRSPGSAKFEWITEPDCKITKDGFDYTISSWVDSQNAFGAVVRTRFSGVIRQIDKDNWELQALEFGE